MRTEQQGYVADPSAIGESANWAKDYRHEVSRAVSEHPGSSVLTAFGAGFAIGLAIGISMAVSSSMRSTPRSRAEDLGHRVLDALDNYIPDSLQDRFG